MRTKYVVRDNRFSLHLDRWMWHVHDFIFGRLSRCTVLLGREWSLREWVHRLNVPLEKNTWSWVCLTCMDGPLRYFTLIGRCKLPMVMLTTFYSFGYPNDLRDHKQLRIMSLTPASKWFLKFMQKEGCGEEWGFISEAYWKDTGMACTSMYSINNTIQWSSKQALPMSGL